MLLYVPRLLVDLMSFYFFFKAEDGIRDGHVTGVQTCALPILPMRPFTLLDLVGLEVADHVGQVLRDQLGERFHASPGLSAMAERKARFTERSKDSVHPPVSPTVAETFGAGAGEDLSQVPGGDALLEKVQDGLAEEIALMLESGVVQEVEQVDLALILGAGFPRHRGGITPYLDQVGASQRATGEPFHGERFTRRS